MKMVQKILGKEVTYVTPVSISVLDDWMSEKVDTLILSLYLLVIM